MVHWSIGSAALGTAILIPGPIDAFVFTAGFVAGAWVGGFAAVVAYNVLGASLVLVGISGILNDVGHDRQRTSLQVESSTETTSWASGYCDPNDIPWWC